MTTVPKIDVPSQIENPEFMPTYGSAEAAGADVRANIEEEIILPPGNSTLIPTGLRLEIPQGYEIQVRPRSGLALKNQVTVLNSPGTIDSDYRGEVGIILINHGKENFTIKPGMRIAQLVLTQVMQANFFVLKTRALETSARGAGGFGHTGVH